KSTNIGQPAYFTIFVFGAVSFGSIFHDEQTMTSRQRQDRIHVAGMTVQVNHYDSPGSGCDLFFNQGCIDGPSLRLDVDENRPRATIADYVCRCYEGQGGHNHFVPGCYSQGNQCQMQRGSSVTT